MPDSGFEARELRALVTDLKQLDKQVLREFRKEVRTAVKPAVADAKREAAGLPHVPSELRAAMSKAVLVEVPSTAKRAGVFVKLKRSRLPARMQAIPNAINRRGFWRHPHWGRDQWSRQESTQGWFDDVFRPHFPRVQQSVERAMDNAAKRLKLK